MNPAYIAGIVDGEGSFYITRNSSTNYTACCSVGMTYRPLIDQLRAQYGGSFWQHPKEVNLTIWYWRVTGHKLLTLLQDIRPYLRVKARQAWLLEEFLAQRHNCTEYRVSPRELALREGFRLAVKWTNSSEAN